MQCFPVWLQNSSFMVNSHREREHKVVEHPAESPHCWWRVLGAVTRAHLCGRFAQRSRLLSFSPCASCCNWICSNVKLTRGGHLSGHTWKNVHAFALQLRWPSTQSVALSSMRVLQCAAKRSVLLEMRIIPPSQVIFVNYSFTSHWQITFHSLAKLYRVNTEDTSSSQTSISGELVVF